MNRTIYISGGQRSGKSSFAIDLAKKSNKPFGIIATAEALDTEMAERIKHHKKNRDNNINVYEETLHFSNLKYKENTIIIDCITLWVSNIFFYFDEDIAKSLTFAKTEIKKILQYQINFLFISNEIGMGIIPDNKLSRDFTDLHGWVNQYLGKHADEQYFMVSGTSIKIK